MGTDHTHTVIRGALEVHRELGPGLLESAYRACLVHELRATGLRVGVEVPLAVDYRGMRIDCGYRLDLMVEDELIVEIKSVKAFDPIHMAQVLTYIRLCRKPVALLINFNVLLLRDGIRRVIASSV